MGPACRSETDAYRRRYGDGLRGEAPGAAANQCLRQHLAIDEAMARFLNLIALILNFTRIASAWLRYPPLL